MLDVEVDIPAGEVSVITAAGKVKAQTLIDTVNRTMDSAHSFQAKLKKGPERKKE